jgi:hypothetical protein
MNRQDALTTSLYSQLLEEAIANECIAYYPGLQGSFAKEKRREKLYWYWVGRINKKVSRIYIGPDNSKTQKLVNNLEQRKDVALDAIKSLKKTAKAYKGASGQINEPSHFKVIKSLSEQGLFKKDILLIGSHGFLSICNALGISVENSFLKTTDVDFVRPQGITLAIPNNKDIIDIPSAISRFDKNFFPIPKLDNKEPSTSLQNNTSKIKIDFLTTEESGRKNVFYEDLGIAAESLKFMSYLLNGDIFKGLIIGNYAIPVNLPDPARFAVHKLIISEERASFFQSKSKKDRSQASVLLDYLINDDSEHLEDALLACKTIKGAVKNIKKSLLKLNDDSIVKLITKVLNDEPSEDSGMHF